METKIKKFSKYIIQNLFDDGEIYIDFIYAKREWYF